MTNSEIRDIIDSSVLEEYALGLLDAPTVVKVERGLEQSAELRDAYDEIQESLAQLVNAGSVEPPVDLRASILNEIKPAVSNQPPTLQPKFKSRASVKRMNRMVVAAAISVFVLAGVAISEWNRAAKLERQLESLQADYQMLEESFKMGELQLAALDDSYERVSDPTTQKINLTGSGDHLWMIR